LVLGVVAVTLRDAIPWQGLSAWAERAVGALLVGLGLWTIRRATRTVLHAHPHGHEHSHGESPSGHAHVHAHPLGAGHDPGQPSGGAHRHGHAALGIGFVHGLAGFGHLWAALPALALPRFEAALYLAAYGLGTLAAMSLFSSILGHFGARASAAGTRALRGAMAAAGLVAVSVGIWWMWGGGA
jgi:sulfite exporter TauE/SafE